MLVVLTNQQDEAAINLANRWKSQDVYVLTPEGLSVSGWRYEMPSGCSRAVIGGREIAPEEITGVLTRMPCVSEQDLDHFMPDDRAYAASEMTAFLLAWLSGLTCPMLNRPVPGCLSGPSLRTEQWVRLAGRLGIPACPVHRKTPQDSTPPLPTAEVVVIGDRCVGAVDPVLAGHARMLAQAAGVELLLVYFSSPKRGGRLVNASLWPDLWQSDVVDAILDYFQRRAKC
ncbi:MAG TPA: hypothetical protein VG649_11755 [Candidatus Angelobacter sp.]|jgi:hypothetical protein|nr:hypothetical protein [Candidatus Angelobacter sp.]